MLPTVIVGLIFATIIFFAGKKTYVNAKNKSCGGCSSSSGCSTKTKCES